MRTPITNIDEYSALALRTINKDLDSAEMLQNAAMGLCGEAGEVIDHVKKHYFQGGALDTEKLAKEAGDVAWYLNLLAYCLRKPLSEILAMNIDKLAARYPEGFDAERSNHRAEGDI